MSPPELGSSAAGAVGGRNGGRNGNAGAAEYRTAEVARILGVSPHRVRRMVYAGHCAPDRRGRAYRFDFQDLVLLRTAHGLTRGAVSPRRVNRALRQLKKQLPAHRPLTGVRITAEGGQVVVRDRDAVWNPESGQQVFHFAVDELAAQSRSVVLDSRARKAAAAAQSATDWFEYGVRVEQDEPDEARKAYQHALELDPELTDAYINLGRLVHEAGDPAGAARFYDEALQRCPEDPITHYNMAVALEDLDRPVAARPHYEKAVEINPRFGDAHFNLGRLLERLGHRTAALEHLLAYRRLSDE